MARIRLKTSIFRLSTFMSFASVAFSRFLSGGANRNSAVKENDLACKSAIASVVAPDGAHCDNKSDGIKTPTLLPRTEEEAASGFCELSYDLPNHIARSH
ncbi:hypothetical protein P5V15_006137 [Pogonomyrmex californicus]